MSLKGVIMELKLKNIGIIKDSSIKLDGLTIITGHNNSGKTTVGKVAFSIIDGVSRLERKFEIDKRIYLLRKMDKILEALELPLFIRREFPEDKSLLSVFISKGYWEQRNIIIFY